MRSWLIVFTLLMWSANAHADYYYNHMGSNDSVGPFATYTECQEARYRDSSGTNSNLCTGNDPATTPATPVLNPGIFRLYGGGAFGAVSHGEFLSSNGYMVGLQMGRGELPNSHLYAFIDVGYGEQDIKDATGATSHLTNFDLVIGPEIAGGAGPLHAYVQLGFGLVIADMSGNDDMLGLKGSAGVDISLSKTFGVLLFGMGSATGSLPGPLVAGIAIESRSNWLVALRAP